jgi:hypothetical protein
MNEKTYDDLLLDQARETNVMLRGIRALLTVLTIVIVLLVVFGAVGVASAS